MPNPLRHFSIACDDVERARRFYGGVFGWRIEPWGPPGFYQIFPDPSRAVTGDLRERTDAGADDGLHGFVCTFGVDDLQAFTVAVAAHGGRTHAREMRIEGVGNLAYFVDTEGNRFGAMKYDRT